MKKYLLSLILFAAAAVLPANQLEEISKEQQIAISHLMRAVKESINTPKAPPSTVALPVVDQNKISELALPSKEAGENPAEKLNQLAGKMEENADALQQAINDLATGKLPDDDNGNNNESDDDANPKSADNAASDKNDLTQKQSDKNNQSQQQPAHQSQHPQGQQGQNQGRQSQGQQGQNQGQLNQPAENNHQSPLSQAAKNSTQNAATNAVAEKIAEAQQLLRQTAQSLQQDNDALQRPLGNAAGANAQAQKNISQQQFSAAQSELQRGLSNVNQARNQLTRQSNQRTSREFNTQRRNLDPLRTPGGNPSQVKIKQQLLNQAKSMAQHALAEYQQGTYDNAEKLLQAAKELDSAGRSRQELHSSDIQDIQRHLAEIQNANLKSLNVAEQSMKNMTKMQNKMQLMAKQRGNFTPEDFQNLAQNLKTELENLSSSLKVLESSDVPENSETSGAKSASENSNAATDNQNVKMPPAGGLSPEDKLFNALLQETQNITLPGQRRLDDLSADTQAVLDDAAQRLEKIQTLGLIDSFDPAEVPPQYRDKIPEYFKNISMEKLHTGKK